MAGEYTVTNISESIIDLIALFINGFKDNASTLVSIIVLMIVVGILGGLIFLLIKLLKGGITGLTGLGKVK